jgi:hypothetical protein
MAYGIGVLRFFGLDIGRNLRYPHTLLYGFGRRKRNGWLLRVFLRQSQNSIFEEKKPWQELR